MQTTTRIAQNLRIIGLGKLYKALIEYDVPCVKVPRSPLDAIKR